MPRLLLVDDTPANLLALEASLRPVCSDLVCVTSGSAALEQVAGGEFAAAIVDVMMPFMDGIETARRMKQISPKLPVLFVTALDEGSRRAEAYGIGAVDYMVKPLDPYALRSKASVLIDFQLCKDELREVQQRLATSEALLAVYQRQ
jgi:CheY-like chemotaxis protein